MLERWHALAQELLEESQLGTAFSIEVRGEFEDGIIASCVQRLCDELSGALESEQTLEQLGARADVDAATVSRLMDGTRPTVRTLLLLATAFHVEFPPSVERAFAGGYQRAFGFVQRKLTELGVIPDNASAIDFRDAFCLYRLVRDDDWALGRDAAGQLEALAALACSLEARGDRAAESERASCCLERLNQILGELETLNQILGDVIQFKQDMQRRISKPARQGKFRKVQEQPCIHACRKSIGESLGTAIEHVRQAITFLRDGAARVHDAAEQCRAATDRLDSAASEGAQAACHDIRDRFKEHDIRRKSSDRSDRDVSINAAYLVHLFARHHKAWILLDKTLGFGWFD